MSDQETLNRNTNEDEPKEETPRDELLDEELDEVVGGAEASGLPTGKRMHKPFTIT
jgi:hypothetical protein